MNFDDFAKQAYNDGVKDITVEYHTTKHGNKDSAGDVTEAIFKDQNGKVIARSIVDKK